MEAPGWLDPETWCAFVEMRRLKGTRAPFTDFAAKRVIHKLVEFYSQGYDANYILAEAAERGWSSVFLTSDTPRRQQTEQERSNVTKISQMVSRIGK